MYNFNRDKQYSYSIFLTRDSAETLNEMIRDCGPSLDPSAQAASARIEVKRKLRVLIDAIRKRERRV